MVWNFEGSSDDETSNSRGTNSIDSVILFSMEKSVAGVEHKYM